MLHKLLIKDKNIHFFYDNESNALFDHNKKPLSFSLGKRENAQEPNIVATQNRVEKLNSPKEIKIVFGHKCNYSCGYCVQRDVGDHSEDKMKPVDLRSKAQKLIQNMKENLDLSELEQIELWGGEIFLYWKDVQEVMTEFDHDEMDWVIPTNGTIMLKSHIDFFRKLKGRVTIELSHDGEKHSKVRGRDFLNKKAPLLKYIENFPEKIRVTLNVVISRTNYDFFEINDFFKKFFEDNDVKPLPITYMPIIVYDKFSRDHSFEKDLDGYSKKLESYLNAHINQFKSFKEVKDDELIQTSLFHVKNDGDDNNGILQWAAKMRSELDSLDSTICGMHQSDKLVLDINGNIKSCQNVGDDVSNGSINDFNETTKALPIQGMNKVPKKEECESCLVKLQCLGGCPLTLDQESFDINCKLSLAHNKTMLLSSFKVLFNSEVEWIGTEKH